MKQRLGIAVALLPDPDLLDVRPQRLSSTQPG
jgi:ABC-type taurine transport system ATPase subunit